MQKKEKFQQSYVHTTSLNTVRTLYRAGTLISTLCTKLATFQLRNWFQNNLFIVLSIFKLIFELIFTKQNVWKLRQKFIWKRKMDAKCVKRKEKKRKNLCLFSQSGGLLHSGLFDKTNLQIVPKSGLLIRASKLQIYKCLSVKLHLQSNVQVI